MKSVSEPDFYIPYTIYPLMQCLFLILVCLLASLPSTAQSTVSGTVVAGDTNEPLAGASVILR
ncbi:MAG: carboxypeptidase-like regulatory domain-containing protein, partial [Muribaculaceae bacterium]|nr:carboxypeptidase-like regulatory domain-containing protein [Muribaculaceae bacterium]